MKKQKKIVLAYSGGLDTSIILKWLQENYDAEVIAYTADVGQEMDRKKIIKNAKKLGVKKIIIQDLKNIFGPVEFPEVESSIKTPSSEQWSKAIRFGDALELSDPNIYDPSQSPWVSFIDTVAKEAAIRPWLYNEEMVELLAEATLEGRTVSDAEWQSTEWWRGSTQKQRDWFLLSQSASGEFVKGLPADAQSKIDDDRVRIRNLMQQAGISNPSDELVNWVGEKFTTGDWTDIYTDDQIKVLADPSIDIALDTDLDNFITSGSIDYDTTSCLLYTSDAADE